VNEEAELLLLQDENNTNLRVLEVGLGLGQCGPLAHFLSHDNATTVLTDGDTNTLKQVPNVSINTSAGDVMIQSHVNSCCGENSTPRTTYLSNLVKRSTLI